MKTFGIVGICLLCLMNICCPQRLVGNQSFICSAYDERVITEIMEDRCYVTPGSIYLSDVGIFLVCGNEMFPLPALEADESGLFFRATTEFDKCPGCRWTKVWGRCPNPKCKRYGT